MEGLLLVSSLLLWMIVLFNLLVTFQLIRIVAPGVWTTHIPRLKTGQIAPDFNIESIQGDKASLSSFTGKPLLLIFLSVRCWSCLNKTSNIKAFSAESQQNSLQINLVLDADLAEAQAFINRYHLSMNAFLADRSDPIWNDYRVVETPFYCLIDDQSRVQDIGLFDSSGELRIKKWKTKAMKDQSIKGGNFRKVKQQPENIGLLEAIKKE